MRLLRAIAVFIAFLVAGSAAWAQSWPARPVRFIVPWAPGGATDLVARLFAEEMSRGLGQPVVIDNRPGAGGMLGSDLAAKAPADGYTIVIVGAGTLYRPFIAADTPFNPTRDFTLIAPLAEAPFGLVVRNSLQAADTAALIQAARSQPGRLNFASAGQGSTSHLAGEFLKALARIDVTHVPYRGGAPALVDIVAGRADFLFDSVTTVLPQARAGQIRLIAVTSQTRSPLAPDVPTVAEGGLADFVLSPWWGVVGPAGIAPPIVQRLNQEIMRVAALPAIATRLQEQGATPLSSSAEDFARFVASETEKWGRIITAAGLRVN
jgi:tripartite-type tricarboxylate transporter receptor subunit TctC